MSRMMDSNWEASGVAAGLEGSGAVEVLGVTEGGGGGAPDWPLMLSRYSPSGDSSQIWVWFTTYS
jgi:hypothetical protein